MSSEITENRLLFHTGHSHHAKNTVRIPESHTLHVGPASCARRHVIKALENEDAEHISHLSISEENLALGSYEEEIIDAIDDLNLMLPKKPKVYFICLKCIDDLIGTDHESLLDTLKTNHPEQLFAITHIDPIKLSSTVSPFEQNKVTQYQFIEAGQERDEGVTLVGSYADIPESCELRDVLRHWNMGPIRRILDCKSYEEYQALGKSKLAIIMSPMGERAARELNAITGMPCCNAPQDYSPKDCLRFYREIAEYSGKDEPEELLTWEQKSKDMLRQTAEQTKNFGLVVDSSASLQSFHLAKTLIEYGFKVVCVTTKEVKKRERDSYEWILEHSPETKIVRTHSYKVLADKDYELDGDLIVIGADYANMIGAKRVVDMWHDEGFFGFRGIIKLCQMIAKAAK
ncbi:MAG: nitrogenase component 1 [Coriobacteriia bacterium]|nr:nitrogenase component 1 [Coriobacteriia bacterium]